MHPSVYLVDPRHDYSGRLSVDSMPLNIGFIKAVMDRELPDVESSLFVYSSKAIEAIRRAPPNVLMLSNYCWNERLALRLARLAKSVRPETLTIWGGPNLPLEPERQVKYLRQHPEIDLYLVGESDFLGCDVIKEFVDAGMSIERFKEREIPSSIYQRDGAWVRQPVRPRTRALDEIPSPWLTGIMDEFFDGRLSPLWETNRGCPFTCTFCVQGTRYYSKVTYFDEERLKEEIRYIGRRISERAPNMGTLRIADPNYGMYERDVRLSEAIGDVQRAYGWPTYIDATTGKNRPERIIESLERVGGVLVLYQAVQSLDEQVLRNVRRSNIKISAYQALNVHLRGRGLRSNSDLILGLPGETLESHLDAMSKLIDSGVDRLTNFQCILLKGSELEQEKSRQEFDFRSAWRVVPKSFGVYAGESVFETEEIIASTSSLSFDDYCTARIYHLGAAVFINHGRFAGLFQLAERLGHPRSQVFRWLVDDMLGDRGEVGTLRDQFVSETKAELFESPEAVVRHFDDPELLEGLKGGELGDNLIYKFASIACLKSWEAFCALALRATWHALGDAAEATGIGALWEDFSQFTLLRYATGPTLQKLLEPRTADLRYDIARWSADGMPSDTSAYRWNEPRRVIFYLPEERAKVVQGAVDVWSLEQSGLTMLIKRITPGSLEREVEIMATT